MYKILRKTDFQMKNDGSVPVQEILLHTSDPLYFNFNTDGKIFSVFLSENVYSTYVQRMYKK